MTRANVVLRTHSYTPRGACAELWRRRDAEVLVAGPAGTGKSRTCLEKLHLLMLRYPGAKGLIVRKTASSLTNTALDTWRKFVAVEAIETGDVEWFGGSGAEPPCFRYLNGSRVNVAGMDKSSKVMSSEYDVIYVQEATELVEGDWEALTTRLRNGRIPYQQIIADCNPDVPTHWLKVRCDTGRTVLLESQHEDNPTLFDSTGAVTQVGRAYLGKLDALTGVRHHRLRKGLWVAAEGIIYEEFDPAVHLIDRMWRVPPEWTRWWAVDFGYTNPFVLQCWAEDPDGRLVLYREIYHTKRIVSDHAEKILDIVAPRRGPDEPRVWREPKPRAIICDHDAEDRATLERALGVSTVAAKKTVSDGLQAVKKRMVPAGDGKPRIQIVRDCVVERDRELLDAKKPTCTQEEIVGYVWDDKGNEKPVKEDDHGCDAMRYMVAQRDLRGRSRVRWL